VSRPWWFARSYGFDLLIVVGAIESALEVALRHDVARQLNTTLWFAVPAVAAVFLVYCLVFMR
jgi:energy-converting hydrogenase Eha subunit E